MRKSAALPSRLRRLFVEHNCAVVGFAFLALAAAVALWALAYLGAFFVTILGLTIVRGPDAVMPLDFTLDFAVIAFALLVLAWFDKALDANDRPPDKKPAFEIFMDLLLAIPRTTLAVWGNLSAWQWLDETDLQLAAGLIERVARERRIRLQSVPLDIPNERSRERIIFALLLIHVLDVRHEDDDAWLRLSPLRPAALQFFGRSSLEQEQASSFAA
jgi:hypothetical protein